MRYQVAPFFLSLLIVGLLFSERFSVWEGEYFPVVSRFELKGQNTFDEGVAFYGVFEKYRSCEFISTQWYKNGVRLLIEYAPDASKFPVSRPMGTQVVGPWLLYDIPNLDNVTAITKHQCHPMWNTVTDFYP